MGFSVGFAVAVAVGGAGLVGSAALGVAVAAAAGLVGAFVGSAGLPQALRTAPAPTNTDKRKNSRRLIFAQSLRLLTLHLLR